MISKVNCKWLIAYESFLRDINLNFLSCCRSDYLFIIWVILIQRDQKSARVSACTKSKYDKIEKNVRKFQIVLTTSLQRLNIVFSLSGLFDVSISDGLDKKVLFLGNFQKVQTSLVVHSLWIIEFFYESSLLWYVKIVEKFRRNTERY